MLNSQIEHEEYINRCFTLALRGDKKVKTNPRVGAILVHNKRIIGEGYHHEHGQAHAEVHALQSVTIQDKHLIKESTLYVSLEPCCFEGKTGACTNLIIEHQIPKVIISTLDPNDKVSGKGVAILRNHGVEVLTGVLETKGKYVIRDFSLLLNKKRPFITLKWAKSTDNFVGQIEKRISISNEQSQLFVHRLRSKNDGILIGVNTAIVDNPQLTNRLSSGGHPIRIVLDSHNKTPKESSLKSDGHMTLIYTATSVESNKNVTYINSNMELETILEDLFSRGIYRLMVEGGPSILKSFIKASLWDEAFVITGTKKLKKGIKAPNLEGQLIDNYQLDGDLIQRIIPNNVKYR